MRSALRPRKVKSNSEDVDDEVIIKIEDTGKGIAEENLDKIFDVFFQEEDHMTRRYGGLGMGLSIARGLVNLHKGRIWAESEGLGKGAIFCASQAW